ncbi:MAG: AI-2E family transporter, partial [Acidimicrobiales bacterium]|nr:AI-2E family transporter [Acidimicrobiales bacterium]
WIVERVAPARRNAVDRAGSAAMGTLRSYLMAVSLAGVVDAFAIGLGLWIIGVPLVIPLAVITFFAAFLPVVGATAAGVLAATVALVANGPIEALVVVALTLVVQQLEGNLVLPVLMGNHVPLHPVVVLVALTAGGSLAGIIGAFVAVPFAAMVTAAAGAFRAEIPDRHLTV